MKLYTIGFTEKSASDFFGLLREGNVRKVADVRLNNTSQLAGFSKKDDLAFFLRELGGIEYEHLPILAPTREIFDAFKKQAGSWADFSTAFTSLMRERGVERRLDPEDLADACLLCSEHRPDHCHRRVVAEYLADHWEGVDVVHLM